MPPRPYRQFNSGSKINSTYDLWDDNKAIYDAISGDVMSNSYTVDLNQAAATYDVCTTTADTFIRGLTISVPRDCSADAGFTGISIQTNATTAQTFISQANGVKANLTESAQLAWGCGSGAIFIPTGGKIQLTIYGAATGTATALKIYVQFERLGTSTI